MDAPLMCKLECKTKAERPYSREGMPIRCQTDNCCNKICKIQPRDKCKKKKCSAYLRKPDAKEEILILVCIIKKALKMLCRNKENVGGGCCKKPEYEHIYFFVDLTKRLDCFIEKFIKIYCGRNNLCCYSKLLKELKCIRYALSKEIETNYNLYRCKIDLINCLMASFRSVENKMCYIMANSREEATCEPACETNCPSNNIAKCGSKLNCCKLLKNQCSGQKISKNKAFKELCDCPDTGKTEKPKSYDMTLEYCKYNIDRDNDECSSDGEADCIQRRLPNGYIKSKIYKKDDTVSLSIKCVTDADGSGLSCLKTEAGQTKSEKLMKLAFDMAQMLNVSKKWYDSGTEALRRILENC